jgi:hypothetical protein
MPRKVFFSFHYERDVHRVMQVRNSWMLRPGGEASPFYDKAEFEEVKRRAGGIERWIEQQLAGTSVTVVLFGTETSSRPWVRHEIKRSFELGKGLLAIDIHNVRHPHKGADLPGVNPLSTFTVGREATPMNRLYSEYDWVLDDGYNNIGFWIEAAARAANR